jgi:hypothetical protein
LKSISEIFTAKTCIYNFITRKWSEAWWLVSVIIATQEAEIGRMET